MSLQPNRSNTMNTKINDGGPAFPVPMFTRQADGQPMSSVEFEMGGMSLRDWFAGQALVGLLVNFSEHIHSMNACVDLAYDAADKMIKARSERKETE